ncbi:MAG: hypothetical protein IKY19_07175 [Bacteroidaceae bacterium]|nr:hypothetical protein [Bacteroidaceae bacterium]
MDTEDYVSLTKDSRLKKCTVYDIMGYKYSGIYDGETFKNNELSLCLILDSDTKEKLKNAAVERNKNGDVVVAIRVSTIQKIVF